MIRKLTFLSLICLIIPAVVTCQDFSVIEDTGPRRISRDRSDSDSDSDRNVVDYTPIEDIEDFDIGELKKKTKTSKNCRSYASGVSSFSLTRVLNGVKNCIAQEIDSRLAPICEKRVALEAYRDQICDTERDEDKQDRCYEQVEQALEDTEDLQDEVTDEILEIADEMEEEFENYDEKLDDKIDENKGNSNRVKRFGIKLFKTGLEFEGRHLVSFTERKAEQVCGSGIDFSKLK